MVSSSPKECVWVKGELSLAVGSLKYVMVCIRAYITHAVGVVSRFMPNPGREHWEIVYNRRYINQLEVQVIKECWDSPVRLCIA